MRCFDQKREREENREVLAQIRADVEFRFPDASKEKVNAEIKKKFCELKRKKLQLMYKVGPIRIKKQKTFAEEWRNLPNKKWF